MLRVVAGVLEDHLALEASRLEVFVLQAMLALEVNTEVLAGRKFTVAAGDEALVALAVTVFGSRGAIAGWAGLKMKKLVL